MNLTLDELSIVALYRATTQQETMRNLYAVPVERIEPDLQNLFRSAREKVKGMSEAEFAQLDFSLALVTDEEDSDGGA